MRRRTGELKRAERAPTVPSSPRLHRQRIMLFGALGALIAFFVYLVYYGHGPTVNQPLTKRASEQLPSPPLSSHQPSVPLNRDLPKYKRPANPSHTASSQNRAQASELFSHLYGYYFHTQELRSEFEKAFVTLYERAVVHRDKEFLLDQTKSSWNSASEERIRKALDPGSGKTRERLAAEGLSIALFWLMRCYSQQRI